MKRREKMNPLFNMDLPVEERAAETIKQMTLEEKVSQLVYKSAAIERLGIPAYHWWNECLHGVARCGTATVFPQAIGLAAMFDAEFLKRVAEAISDEIRGKYNAYQSIGDNSIYKGITEYAPNINIFRDPRWGRGQETYGEDPFLTAELGIAFIQGIQGEDEKYRKADANVKHYVVHSGPDELRHEIDVKIDEKQFRETYLYAFARCIREADVACVMGAYNRVNGAPCSGSTYLLKDILRDELGFKGYVVSDSFAIDDFHLHHKITATPVESAAMAFNHGCDQNGGTTFLFLTEAVEQGLVKEEDIDISVQRLLEERIRLGMFDSAEAVPFNKIRDSFRCERIVYISCKPTSLARDILEFSKGGYHVKRVCCVDMFPNTVHVETVVLLSRKTPDDTIEVDLNLDELDATSAETKATYEEIKKYVKEKYQLKVSNLYISQIKRKCGIEVGINYNLPKSENPKVPQCPPEKERAIRDALEHFQMVS